MVLVQKELKNAYLGEYTQPLPNAGPCPAGFHIPNTTENPMETIWQIGLSGDTTEMGVYLHIPPMGTLLPTSASKDNFGTECALWSCSGDSLGVAEAFSDYNVSPAKAAGLPIRPFKDTPVAPDSSRTQTYDGSSETGISGTGIFYKASAGLITMSSDAQNWITIADKNVGATTVYNDGDTMSQANCGNYYQRGNNYGFPFTGPTTTSSTLVDASGYGPSNPYSSSTFIFGQKPSMMAMGEDWSSVANNNLWGGEGREPESGWRELTDTFNDTMTTTDYYWGVCFTPKVDCDLTGVKFLNYRGNYSATLRISKGDYASSSVDRVSYSMQGSVTDNIYELPTSYHLQANQKYCVSVYEYALRVFGINTNLTLPVTKDIITFNYSTDSSQDTAIYSKCYCIAGINIEL